LAWGEDPRRKSNGGQCDQGSRGGKRDGEDQTAKEAAKDQGRSKRVAGGKFAEQKNGVKKSRMLKKRTG